MAKNYVYKLCKEGIVYADLNTAVAEAVYFMSECEEYKVSKPLVTKVRGGYQVLVVDSMGTPHYRRIDVFEPRKQVKQEKFFMDRTFHFERPAVEWGEQAGKKKQEPKIDCCVQCECCGNMIEGDKAVYIEDVPFCDNECVANHFGTCAKCIGCREWKVCDCDGKDEEEAVDCPFYKKVEG